MTRVGRYQVEFSIPSEVFGSFVKFSVDDIGELAHARVIERALLDGGCGSVHLSIRTANKEQPFVALPMNDLSPGSVRSMVERILGEFRRAK